MLSTLDRYWQTLRHLRPVQFYGRLWFRLARQRPDLSPAPPLRVPDGPWLPPACREPSLAGPRSFVFLGESGNLDAVGWDGPAREKLWRYNQHYFDDLNALDSASRAAWHHDLLLDWLAHNPPGMGNGWEPYPVSLRIVNWVKWALAGNALPEACVHSLAVQARWLTRRLEIHLLGNHLFANAKALVFAGLFFDGEEARGWMRTGLRILAREVPEQILSDGGHFERSTMYHALALEDLLDLCNVGACYRTAPDAEGARQLEGWRARVPAMQAWLHALSHPDGEIAFFNDAALGIAPAVAELDAYCARLGLPALREFPPLHHLAASGLVRLQRGEAVALVDVAPVGPDYLPGHAHADTLSFELSLGAQRVLVNSGTSCYGTSAERLRQRGTAAHNTVIVDGDDSSEVWGGFRVARRARPTVPQLQANGVLDVRCAHDGYTRLPGAPVHERRWLLEEGSLRVIDTVSGRFGTAEARFHFHPDVTLGCGDDPARGTVRLLEGRVLHWQAEAGAARIEAATWHPRFGVSLPNVCLVVRLVGGESRFLLSWGDALPVNLQDA